MRKEYANRSIDVYFHGCGSFNTQLCIADSTSDFSCLLAIMKDYQRLLHAIIFNSSTGRACHGWADGVGLFASTCFTLYQVISARAAVYGGFLDWLVERLACWYVFFYHLIVDSWIEIQSDWLSCAKLIQFMICQRRFLTNAFAPVKQV